MSTTTYTVRPIGVVRSPIKQPADDCWGNLVSIIELDANQFTPDATMGLADYSHVEIVFLLDRIPPETMETGARHPRNRSDWPKVGIFAQRSKNRPNRIAVTTCKLERIDGLRISVRELDAIDGTPVLDIKPYLQEFAPREPVRQAAWSKELMAKYFKPGE